MTWATTSYVDLAAITHANPPDECCWANRAREADLSDKIQQEMLHCSRSSCRAEMFEEYLVHFLALYIAKNAIH